MNTEDAREWTRRVKLAVLAESLVAVLVFAAFFVFMLCSIVAGLLALCGNNFLVENFLLFYLAITGIAEVVFLIIFFIGWKRGEYGPL